MQSPGVVFVLHLCPWKCLALHITQSTFLQNHAARAIALCANPTIVCSGVVIGTILGGPLGGLVAVLISTPIGICTEVKIAKLWVTNPDLRAQFDESAIRYFRETARNFCGAAMGTWLGKWLGSFISQKMGLGILGSAFLKKFGPKIGFLADVIVYASVKK